MKISLRELSRLHQEEQRNQKMAERRMFNQECEWYEVILKKLKQREKEKHQLMHGSLKEKLKVCH